MQISREVYNERILNIIGAAFRFIRNGGDINRMPVACWVRQYGFSTGFSKTEELAVALKELVSWVRRYRINNRGRSPEQSTMVKLVRTYMKKQ